MKEYKTPEIEKIKLTADINIAANEVSGVDIDDGGEGETGGLDLPF